MTGVERPSEPRGFALITVLWAMLILAAIATSILATGRTESRLSATHRGIAELDAVADAAINLTILHLLASETEERPPVDASPFTIDFAGYRIAMTAQDESGKIDLNMADPDLLRQLLIAAGVDNRNAQPLLDKILDWRENAPGKRLNGAKAPEYQRAGLLYGPRNAPFQSIEELQLVMGMTPALYQRLAPSLTIYSQTPWVDPAFAPRDVMSALNGLSGPATAPTQPATDASRTSGVMVGHAFTLRAVLQGPDGLRVMRSAVIRLNGTPSAPYGIYRWD